MNIIMRTVFGSNLYGTNTPTSDFDYKSVFIPSARDIILQRAKGVVSNSTKTDNTIKNSLEDVDDELFSLYKLMQMLNAGDMIATELLFVPQEKLLVTSPLWNSLVTNRHLLISKEIKGFKGYVSKQVSKYGVKGSRVAAVRLVLESFDACATQTKIGDYSDYWENLSKTSEFINVVDVPQPSGKSMLHLEVCGRKLPYTVSVKEGINVIQKLFDNYGARALQAENNEGVDWKSVHHAIRVSEQAIELLTTENITFPRPNAEDLLKIRKGSYTFKIIQERLEENMIIIDNLSTSSKLIEKIDINFVEDILFNAYLNKCV
jgi:hypothetical protein